MVLIFISISLIISTAAFLWHYGFDLTEILNAISSISVALGAMLAFYTYKSNSQDKESDEFLKEYKNLLERSYDIFTEAGDYPVSNDRLLWLTVARILIRADHLKSKIRSKTYLFIANEYEEYFSFKYHALLDDNEEYFKKSYFCPDGEIYSPSSIAPNSIAIIFHFSNWKADSDPIDRIDSINLIAEPPGVIPLKFSGIYEYLQSMSGYWNKIEKKARKSEKDGELPLHIRIAKDNSC